MSNNTQSLLLSGAAVAIVAAGLAVASSNEKRMKKKPKRRSTLKIKSRKCIPLKQVETDFDHSAINEQLPATMEDLQDLYERDFPRMEGLEEKQVEILISELKQSAIDVSVDLSEGGEEKIRKGVLGCCTQAILAQVLSFLMDEEKLVAREESIMLHDTLSVNIDPSTKSIIYHLSWRVVSAEDPEFVIGYWKAQLKLGFRIVRNGQIVQIGGNLSGKREEYEYEFA